MNKTRDLIRDQRINNAKLARMKDFYSVILSLFKNNGANISLHESQMENNQNFAKASAKTEAAVEKPDNGQVAAVAVEKPDNGQVAAVEVEEPDNGQVVAAAMNPDHGQVVAAAAMNPDNGSTTSGTKKVAAKKRKKPPVKSWLRRLRPRK